MLRSAPRRADREVRHRRAASVRRSRSSRVRSRPPARTVRDRGPGGTPTRATIAVSGKDARDGGPSRRRSDREAKASVRLPEGPRGGRRTQRGAAAFPTPRGAATKGPATAAGRAPGRPSGRPAATRPARAGRASRTGPTGAHGPSGGFGVGAAGTSAFAPRRGVGGARGRPDGQQQAAPLHRSAQRNGDPAPSHASTPPPGPSSPARRSAPRPPRGGVRARSPGSSGRLAGSRPGCLRGSGRQGLRALRVQVRACWGPSLRAVRPTCW